MEPSFTVISVTLLNCNYTKSMEDFDIEQTNLHHKLVIEKALDRLENKTHTQLTTYQTKWVVVVMKDK